MRTKDKPEDFMYDSSDADWSDDKLSDYWKEIEAELDRRLGFVKEGGTYKRISLPVKKERITKKCHRRIKEWTPEDTRRLYPSLTEAEAKMAWEMGW